MPYRHHPQILIVEDDPSLKELMRLVVEKEDHWEPTSVTNGAHAVEAWNNGEFDVIIMDLRLPLLDGIQATAIIRKMETSSGRKPTPIIAFTALTGEEVRQKCAEAGINDFIAKPANLKDVVETIYKYLP